MPRFGWGQGVCAPTYGEGLGPLWTRTEERARWAGYWDVASRTPGGGTAQGRVSGPRRRLCARLLEHRAPQTPRCMQGPGLLPQGPPRSRSGSTPASVSQACSWLHLPPPFLACFLRRETPVLINML